MPLGLAGFHQNPDVQVLDVAAACADALHVCDAPDYGNAVASATIASTIGLAVLDKEKVAKGEEDVKKKGSPKGA